MTLRNPRTLFTVAALGIATICIAIVRPAAFGVNPDVAAWGVTFDLTITIPLIYYVMLVRPRHVAPLTIAPLFVVCLALAARIVPHTHQSFLHDLRLLGAPLELVTIALVVRRASRLRGANPSTDDPLERFAAVATQLFGNVRVGEAVGFEVATFWYAFAGARKPRPTEGHTFHERNDWRSILMCIMVLLIAESVALHFFVMRWSVAGAWVVTFLDVYGIVWLIGDYHALRLRVTTIDAEAIELRYGIRWRARIERTNIASVTTIARESEWKRKRVLKIAILDEPRLLITLRDSIVVHGIAGITKRVDAFALLPDDVEAFARELA